MRILAGVDRPDGGVRIAGHQVVTDYFAQDQAAVLDGTRTVYEEMSASSPVQMVPMIRHILGGFLFTGDDVYKRVGVLSGGERNRLALAKMLLNPSNLLILDEPTNHLDLDSKEVLLDALADYGGTLIFVSHDRYFVDRLASKVIEVGGGQALIYPGGYEDFLYWKKQRESGLTPPLPTKERKPVVHLKEAAAAPKPAAGATPAARAHTPKAVPAKADGTRPARSEHAPAPSYDPLAPRLRPTGAPPDRQAREREARKAKARLAELEREIGEKEQAVKDIEHLMATPGFYEDRATADRSVAERQELLGEVEALMSEWESLQTAAEAKG
jgi:ATP-binding cassette, subfamily F, member 3